MSRNAHLATPAELKERIEAERLTRPFVIYRDDTGTQRIVLMDDGTDAATIGRADTAQIALPWDPHVSGLHAELRNVGGQWLVIDDGVSRNGTFVNGHRVVGRQRLADADQISVGQTTLLFRRPVPREGSSTLHLDDGIAPPQLSPAQRRVLVALCRPFRDGAEFARPATNQQIADELVLSVAAVKTHLRSLCQRFGIEGLPQNEKRIALARRAFETGAVSPSELQASHTP